MKIIFEPRFGRNVFTIFPGEYQAVSTKGMIATLLGSCVSVVLYDPIAGVGGMNHFMLPSAIHTEKYYQSQAGKYGIYAMELLINELLKRKGQKKNFKAKVFGGGCILAKEQGGSSQISDSNIQMAFDFLHQEEIPIISSDVGGDYGRKIYYCLENSKVYVKKIKRTYIPLVHKRENEYYKSLSREANREGGGVTLFG